MPDRVREAVFSILGSHYGCPGSLPPLSVADLFAGSGSMGLEALSRGAAACCFFERDLAALDALRHNLDALCAGPAATIVTQDAWRMTLSDRDKKPFDLVFLDPPYQDSDDTSEGGTVRQYLERMGKMRSEKTLMMLHHSRAVRYTASMVVPWKIVDQRMFGTHAITLLAR